MKDMSLVLIHRAALQFLESFYIVENSKAPDTVIGRLSFIEKLIEQLREGFVSHKYLSAIQEGIDSYKSGYYDRVPSDTALTILLDPRINIIAELYCILCYNSLGKSFEDFVTAMNRLKVESAKENRKKKMLEMIQLVRRITVEKGNTSPSFEKVLKSIDNIEEMVSERSSFEDITFTHEGK